MPYDSLDNGLEPSTSIVSRASRGLRKRWVQVALLFVGAALVMAISTWALAPKRQARTKEPKYLYCPKCEIESRYDAKLDGEPCPKCTQEPVGKLEGRETSIKETSYKSPWKRVYIALSLEGIVAFAGSVYLLSRRAPSNENTYYVFYCPNCSQRLRFRHVSLGGLGQCSRCKRPVRFPNEDDAIREEDLIREEQQRMLAEEEEAEDEE